MIILSSDILAHPPSESGDLIVDATIFDGKVVYRRAAAAITTPQ